MKPLVIISEFSLFGKTQMLYNVVWHWKDRANDSEVSKDEALQVIKDYKLPLVHKDRNGEIYADETDSPYMKYKESFIKSVNKDQKALLRQRRRWIIEEMGGGSRADRVPDVL